MEPALEPQPRPCTRVRCGRAARRCVAEPGGPGLYRRRSPPRLADQAGPRALGGGTQRLRSGPSRISHRPLFGRDSALVRPPGPLANPMSRRGAQAQPAGPVLAASTVLRFAVGLLL